MPNLDLDARLAALDGAETAERVDALNALPSSGPTASGGHALAVEARELASRVGYPAGRAAATVALGWVLHAQGQPLGDVAGERLVAILRDPDEVVVDPKGRVRAVAVLHRPKIA